MKPFVEATGRLRRLLSGMRGADAARRPECARRARNGHRPVAVACDRGSALPLNVFVALLVVGAGAVGGVLVAGTVVHGQAQAAADMVAVAAAGQLLSEPGPCATAEDIAGRNEARLLACEVTGATVLVEVAVALPRPIRVVGHDEARASAAAELRFDPGEPPQP